MQPQHFSLSRLEAEETGTFVGGVQARGGNSTGVYGEEENERPRIEIEAKLYRHLREQLGPTDGGRCLTYLSLHGLGLPQIDFTVLAPLLKNVVSLDLSGNALTFLPSFWFRADEPSARTSIASTRRATMRRRQSRRTSIAVDDPNEQNGELLIASRKEGPGSGVGDPVLSTGTGGGGGGPHPLQQKDEQEGGEQAVDHLNVSSGGSGRSSPSPSERWGVKKLNLEPPPQQYGYLDRGTGQGAYNNPIAQQEFQLHLPNVTPNLWFLDLSDNRFVDLPHFALHLPMLGELKLQQNDSLPSDVAVRALTGFCCGDLWLPEQVSADAVVSSMFGVLALHGSTIRVSVPPDHRIKCELQWNRVKRRYKNHPFGPSLLGAFQDSPVANMQTQAMASAADRSSVGAQHVHPLGELDTSGATTRASKTSPYFRAKSAVQKELSTKYLFESALISSSVTTVDQAAFSIAADSSAVMRELYANVNQLLEPREYPPLYLSLWKRMADSISGPIVRQVLSCFHLGILDEELTQQLLMRSIANFCRLDSNPMGENSIAALCADAVQEWPIYLIEYILDIVSGIGPLVSKEEDLQAMLLVRILQTEGLFVPPRLLALTRASPARRRADTSTPTLAITARKGGDASAAMGQPPADFSFRKSLFGKMQGVQHLTVDRGCTLSNNEDSFASVFNEATTEFGVETPIRQRRPPSSQLLDPLGPPVQRLGTPANIPSPNRLSHEASTTAGADEALAERVPTPMVGSRPVSRLSAGKLSDKLPSQTPLLSRGEVQEPMKEYIPHQMMPNGASPFVSRLGTKIATIKAEILEQQQHPHYATAPTDDGQEPVPEDHTPVKDHSYEDTSLHGSTIGKEPESNRLVQQRPVPVGGVIEEEALLLTPVAVHEPPPLTEHLSQLLQRNMREKIPSGSGGPGKMRRPTKLQTPPPSVSLVDFLKQKGLRTNTPASVVESILLEKESVAEMYRNARQASGTAGEKTPPPQGKETTGTGGSVLRKDAGEPSEEGGDGEFVGSLGMEEIARTSWTTEEEHRVTELFHVNPKYAAFLLALTAEALEATRRQDGQVYRTLLRALWVVAPEHKQLNPLEDYEDAARLIQLATSTEAVPVSADSTTEAKEALKDDLPNGNALMTAERDTTAATGTALPTAASGKGRPSSRPSSGISALWVRTKAVKAKPTTGENQEVEQQVQEEDELIPSGNQPATPVEIPSSRVMSQLSTPGESDLVPDSTRTGSAGRQGQSKKLITRRKVASADSALHRMFSQEDALKPIVKSLGRAKSAALERAVSREPQNPGVMHPFQEAARAELAKQRHRFDIAQRAKALRSGPTAAEDNKKRRRSCSTTLSGLRTERQIGEHSKQFLPTAVRQYLVGRSSRPGSALV